MMQWETPTLTDQMEKANPSSRNVVLDDGQNNNENKQTGVLNG
jgi:hypothetical protein